MARNRPLWIFLAAFSASGVSFGMFASLQYIYLDSYLQLGPRVAHALAVSVVAAIAALPLWLAIVRRWGKHRPWCVGLVIIAACMGGLALLPAQPQSFWAYMVLAGLISLSGGAGMIAPFSILGDIVDYDTLRTRQRRGGAFFALFTLVIKANMAVGGGLAFLILGWAGYETRAAAQMPSAVWAMKAGFCVLPAILALVAGLILWRFPLDARRHALVRRRIDALERRSA